MHITALIALRAKTFMARHTFGVASMVVTYHFVSLMPPGVDDHTDHETMFHYVATHVGHWLARLGTQPGGDFVTGEC